MYISIILMAALILSVSIANVKATGPALSDFRIGNAEHMCMWFGDDKPGMKELCDWINVCDETGDINSTAEFCKGEAIRNPPGPARCPSGFHSVDDDETPMCYTNAGCEYEGYIFRPDNRTCGEILDVCEDYPDLKECTVTLNLGTPQNYDQSKCEYTVPDFCVEPYREPFQYSNGTWIPGTNLNCYNVNITNFRVTVQDRHNFDRDYDGIGCENNETD